MTTNETIKCLMTRRSVRSFDPERIPSDELIKEVVTAGEYAPTGRGMQSPRIVVITNKAVRDRLSKLNAEVMGVESEHPSSYSCLPTRSAPHIFTTALS